MNRFRPRADHFWGVLRRRDLRLLFTASLISLSGGWMYSVVLAAFIFNRTHSLALVGVAGLARFVPTGLLFVYGGWIADRLERVRLIIGADIISCGLQVVLAVVASVGGAVWLAIVLATATSCVSVVYAPATGGLLPQLAGDELVAANAIDGLIQNLVVAIGPALGAAVITVASPTVGFTLNAFSFAVSAILLSRLRSRSRVSDLGNVRHIIPLRQMAVGMVAIAKTRSVRVLVACSLLVSFIYGTDIVVLVDVSRSQLGTGAGGYGYLLAGLGIGGVLVAPAINRLVDANRFALVILGGVAAHCLPTALLAVTHAPALAVTVQVARGAGSLVVDVVAITAMQRAVSLDSVSRVFGAYWALVYAAISFGTVVAPPLLTEFGLHGALVALAIVPTAVSLLGYWALRGVDGSQLRQSPLAVADANVMSLGSSEPAA